MVVKIKENVLCLVSRHFMIGLAIEKYTAISL